MKRLGMLCVLLLALMLAAVFISIPVSAADQDEDGLDDDWESQNGYDNSTFDNWNTKGTEGEKIDGYQEEILPTFLFTLIGSFGVFALMLGGFTAWYAKGRAKVVGGTLALAGTLIGVVFLVFTVIGIKEYPNDTLLGLIHWDVQLFFMPFFTVLAFGLGGFLALLAFLLIIMKA